MSQFVEKMNDLFTTIETKSEEKYISDEKQDTPTDITPVVETKSDERVTSISDEKQTTLYTFNFTEYMNKILKLYKIVFESTKLPDKQPSSYDMSAMVEESVKRSFDEVFTLTYEDDILAKQLEFVPKLYNAIFYYYMKTYDTTFPVKILPRHVNQLMLYFSTLETPTDIIRDELIKAVSDQTYNELRSEPPFHLVSMIPKDEMRSLLASYKTKIKSLIAYLMSYRQHTEEPIEVIPKLLEDIIPDVDQ